MRAFIFILLLLSSFSPVFSQTEEDNDFKKKKKENPPREYKKGFDWRRLQPGGTLNFGFGTVTLIDVSPTLAYMFSEKFAAGIGGTYVYYADRRFTPTFETSIYGGKVFGRYFLFESIFAQAEYEVLNVECFDETNFTFKRVTIGNPLVGGGYAQRLGYSSYIFAAILFNLNQTPCTPYSNPIIRFGMSFGL